MTNFSRESILKQEEALAEIDDSIDDWIRKSEQAENRRTRVRQKLLEHVAAALTLRPSAVDYPHNLHEQQTPPESPEQDEVFCTNERRDIQSIKIYADAGVAALLAEIEREIGFREHDSKNANEASSSCQAYTVHPSLKISLHNTRYYSAAPETASTSTSTSGSPSTGSPSSSEATENKDPIQKELEAKNREIIDLKDRYLRSVADFRNLQDRTKRDIQSARDFAIQKFASDLIESVDNLDRALGTVPPSKLAPQNSDPDASPENNTYNKDLANLYDGLKMTETILMGTLKKHGLERFDPSEGEGETFNPNLHEATFQTKVEGKEDGKVFMTQQKGFLLNGRVLRAAKVGVVKNS
ncbi:MAG: hypothetical protein Q9170_000862 [Blastenia crenularia]